MRIGAAEAYDEMRRDPERWLYILSDLADPIRWGGLFFYRTAGGMAVISDFDEETAVRLYGADRDLLEEAASDPAVGPGTRFCFCAGLPGGIVPVTAGRHRLTDRDGCRTLERYGLFGAPASTIGADPPAGFELREMREADRASFPDTADWRRLAEQLENRAPGDRIWLAVCGGKSYGSGDGIPCGYLWCAEAGRAWYDIVNLFVSKDVRRRGIGKALVSRYAGEARIRGRLPYYGWALSPESAALARSMGFREIYGGTVSLWAAD